MKPPGVELRLPTDVQYVGLARLVVTVAARHAGMADDQVEDLKIAVSEATASAMHATRRHSDDGRVVVTFGPADGRFLVTIADTDPPGDDDDWVAGDGLGVTLIRGLADHVEFAGVEGNVIQMRFDVDEA